MSKKARVTMPYPIGKQVPHSDLRGLVERVLKEVPVEFSENSTDLDVTVQADDLLRFVTGLRDRKELAFDFLRNISGVDFGEEGMALKYNFYSFKYGHALQVTVPLRAAGEPHPVVPSLDSLYPSANWHEREAHEMFGIDFEGHPNLKNLFLEDDLHIHPLLKSHPLQAAEILQGIESGPPGFTF
ncbi:MAG: NADH-quinone oxidoreductase subunit C [Dehalococcoidia bacterium]|nr:NADH-quinone oxidoreductase subunit C [Dehalococcoidia bacterium]